MRNSSDLLEREAGIARGAATGRLRASTGRLRASTGRLRASTGRRWCFPSSAAQDGCYPVPAGQDGCLHGGTARAPSRRTER